MRFYYKEKAGINAKVLRDVKFQMVLDVFEFCTEPLKRRLLPMREKFKAMEERQLEEERQKKAKNSQTAKLNDLGALWSSLLIIVKHTHVVFFWKR